MVPDFASKNEKIKLTRIKSYVFPKYGTKKLSEGIFQTFQSPTEVLTTRSPTNIEKKIAFHKIKKIISFTLNFGFNFFKQKNDFE